MAFCMGANNWGSLGLVKMVIINTFKKKKLVVMTDEKAFLFHFILFFKDNR